MDTLNIVIPANKTVNQFGDFVMAKNAYKHEILYIKRPKKYKAGINIRVENSIETVMCMGKSWEQYAKEVHKPSKHSNKQLYKQRKK